MRVLFVGDIMGSSGRRAVGKLLAALRSRLEADFVIANGENAAGGLGITKPTATAIFDAGVDVITLGNHAFAKREATVFFDEEPRIIRPANYPPEVPGRGWGIFKTSRGESITVVNIIGRTFMNPLNCPFEVIDAIISESGETPGATVVDFHAEATSEKMAMAWHLDGRVSALVGTHTHVQTSDERVLPRGTAYITDAGMTGVQDSVLGLDSASVVERFKTGLLGKFMLAEGEATLQGVVFEIDLATGRATGINRVSELAG